jgi:type I restriction enzyme S subunit
MKQGWEIKEFEDCLEKVVYTNKIQRKDFLVDGEYPIISQEQNFINGYWDNSDDLFKVKKPIIIFGDHTQVLKYVDFDFVLGADGVKILQPKNNIDTRFFFYFLQNINLGSLGYARHYRLLKEIEVSYPKSLPEQQSIVVILDDAFAAIAKAKANAEQNLKNAAALFESYLQGVFENKGEGWEEKTLGEVCGISSKLIDPKKSEFQNLIHIGAGNIESQKGTLKDLKTAKEENLISGKFLFDETMILYSKIRPYLMKVVNCEFQGLCSADIYPLLPYNEKMIKNFLYHLLLSKDFTDYAILGSQRAGMPKVNREHLFAYKLKLPSIKEQKSIVQKLDALSLETKKLEAIYQQKINDLEELKKSVLQKAFAGQLIMDN